MVTPSHSPRGPDDRVTKSKQASPAIRRLTYSEDDEVEVSGSPMHLETGEPRETTRRFLAVWVIAGYTVLCAAGLAAVTFARSDAQAIALILAPYGTIVTAVVTHYFWRTRR